jgi:Amt family ammonium transporter
MAVMVIFLLNGVSGYDDDDRHGDVLRALEVFAFMVSTMFLGAFTYPIFANWAWGGPAAMLGANFALGHGYPDFAGSGVVHSVGGITRWRVR